MKTIRKVAAAVVCWVPTLAMAQPPAVPQPPRPFMAHRAVDARSVRGTTQIVRAMNRAINTGTPEEREAAAKEAARQAAERVVVEDAQRLAAAHAKALGGRLAQLTRKDADRRGKSLATVAVRRVGADLKDAKTVWANAYAAALVAK